MQKHNAAFLAALMCVAHGARAQGSAPRTRVPVAARDLVRGRVLSATDIVWADSALGGTAAHVAAVTPGWIARRTIRAGEVLREPGVSRPDLVSTGNAVDVVYTAPGVTVQVHGTAVGSGAEGDEVFVKLDNRKRLRGIVAGVNTVRVM